MIILMGAILVSFTVAYVFNSLVIRNAGWLGCVDKPDNGRKIHTSIMPTAGGVGIAGGMVAGILYCLMVGPVEMVTIGNTGLIVGAGALFMLAVGLFDDIHNIGAKKKFLAQLVVAYLLLHAGFRFELTQLPFIDDDAYAHALYTIPLTMLWIVGLINAINLIDGLDGLAAGVVGIGFMLLGVIYFLQGYAELVIFSAIVVAAIGGFLVHNFNPASIFMGDSGSLLIGYLLAVFSLAAPAHTDLNIAVLIPMVVLGLPLMDAGFTVVRRVSRRKPIFAPDDGHIHHFLLSKWPVRRAVLVLYAAAFGFGLAAIQATLLPGILAYLVVVLTCTVAVLSVHRLGYFTWRPGSRYSLSVPATRAGGRPVEGMRTLSRSIAPAHDAGDDEGILELEEGVCTSLPRAEEV